MASKVSDKRSFIESVRSYFKDYCHCSGIHGFRYFGEKRTYFEKFWWLIVFICTLGVCFYIITIVYQRWLESPIIVSFSTRDTPIYSIPFPAVTICSETKSIQSKFSYMNTIKKHYKGPKLTEEEKNLMYYMQSVCDMGIYGRSNKTHLDDFVETMENISSTDIPFSDCGFNIEGGGCKKFFKPIITDEGFCYTFNMLDRSEIYREHVKQHSSYHVTGILSLNNWTVENGYAPNAGIKPYPRRALMAGVKFGLSLVLWTKKQDLDYMCKESNQGFKVPLNTMVLAVVTPTMITTSDSVKSYSPARRGCYFSTERYLKNFKTYTEKNCLLECLTNYTLIQCGCVGHYMPRDNDTAICGAAKAWCMYEGEMVYQQYELKMKIESKQNKKARNKGLTDCDCLPTCSDLSYTVDVSQSIWNYSDVPNAHAYFGTNFSIDEYYMSKLQIFFKSSHFITTQRHEFYGPTDFLANFGGLLGLFTGFSVLSLMEAIYFLTVRICCNSRLYGHWAGPH